MDICCSQLYPEETIFFGSWPYWSHFGGSGATNPVDNVKLSWNFVHGESSELYKCHLKHFENLKFLQRQDVSKIWVFGPTLTPLYPLKMAKMKNSHWAINISQNQGSIFYQFSMKIIISLCVIWAKLCSHVICTNGTRFKNQEVTA